LCVEQVEIDEYRDYEKAIGALREALKYLTKDTSRAAEDMAHSIERRIMLIEKFVQVGVLLVRELLSVCAHNEAPGSHWKIISERSLRCWLSNGCALLLLETPTLR
jgi:hypothetical protein